MSDPPPQAYGRVTRDLTALFAPVARAAEEHVAGLEQEFDVTVSRLPPGSTGFRVKTLREVMVSPRDPMGAVLSIGWTDFPGVLLRYGRFGDAVIPPCGCDACAETTEECLEELSRTLAMVTDGFWERVDVADEVLVSVQQPGGWRRTTLGPGEDAAFRTEGPWRSDWAPWQRRGRLT